MGGSKSIIRRDCKGSKVDVKVLLLILLLLSLFLLLMLLFQLPLLLPLVVLPLPLPLLLLLLTFLEGGRSLFPPPPGSSPHADREGTDGREEG